MKLLIFDIQRFEDISNSSNNKIVNGTNESDSIYNTGSNVTINGGYGNDSIVTGGMASNVKIDGDFGDDKIEISDSGRNITDGGSGSLNINGQAGTFIVGGQRFGADYQNKTFYAK